MKQSHICGVHNAKGGVSHNGKAVFRDPGLQETSKVPRIMGERSKLDTTGMWPVSCKVYF